MGIKERILWEELRRDSCGKRRAFLPGAGTCERWTLPGAYVVAQQDESRVSQRGQGMGIGTGMPEAAHCAGGAQGSGLSTRTQEKARQAQQWWAPPNGLLVQLTLHFTVKVRGVSGGFSPRGSAGGFTREQASRCWCGVD